MEAKLMFIHALSPVHTGTGQSVDVVDLPIARETTTNWPYIPGSSIRGVLRDVCEPVNSTAVNGEKKLFLDCFGTEDATQAGQIIICDAKLLCLPVRSFFGTFAWVTCPSALNRLARDCANANISINLQLPESAASLPFAEAVVCQQSKIVGNEPNGSRKIYLEDLDLQVKRSDADAIADVIAQGVFPNDAKWLGAFKERFALVSDDMFSFLCESATEIVARIRINDESKVADEGALWYEEAVPTESIFSSMLIAEPRNGRTSEELFNFIQNKPIGFVQIGGNAGVGRGFVRIVISWGGDSSE